MGNKLLHLHAGITGLRFGLYTGPTFQGLIESHEEREVAGLGVRVAYTVHLQFRDFNTVREMTAKRFYGRLKCEGPAVCVQFILYFISDFIVLLYTRYTYNNKQWPLLFISSTETG